MGSMGVALAAVLWLSAARAQEEPLPDPGPPQYVYALDDQTELTLTFHPKDQKTWGAELRLYGEPAQGQIYSFTGDVRLLTKDVYEYKNGTPPTQKQIRVAGKPGEKSPLEISTRNLTGDDSKPVRIHGTFKPVDDAALEARMKKRYEQADAALNDLLKRTLGEVGKSGEAKLKEAFAARLKLRDAAVDPEADHKGLPYWTTMWNATLESVGFLRSYTGRFATKGFAGSYRMPNGNSLELEVVPEEGLKFTAAVLQHAEDKPGVLTGTARLFTTRAVYKEPANKKDAEGRTPVEATFTQHGHIVHLEAKNTDELAGHGVSFDGDYYKVVPRK